MQAKLLELVQTANSYLADYILIILLVGTGLWFTFKTKFVQIRCFGEGMKKVFGNLSLRGGKNESGLSSFQALATAIAAQVGTGNIVGASGAILVGGPGAIFWMWIIAFLGMATIYAEATLAQETRVKGSDGEIHGGPVYYMKTAFKGKIGTFLAVFFSIAVIIALGFFGTMVQSNSIAESMNNAFGVPGWIVGLILAAVAAFIFLGGIQRIASVTEKLVPIMALLFLAGGVVVLICNITKVPATFGMIFKYAFTPEALIGGGIGAALKTAISQGAKRGLFSNEAGMGSTPHAHAMANVEKPHDQGVVAMTGVFIDTFVVLTMTALVVITTLYNGDYKLAETVKDPGKIVLTVENFDKDGNLVSTDEEYETNLYKLATNQESNNVIAELISSNNLALTAPAEAFGEDYKSVAEFKPENKNVEELVSVASEYLMADSKTYESIAEKDNVLTVDEAVNLLMSNGCLPNVNYLAKSGAMQTAVTEGLPKSFGNFGSIFVAICLLFFAFSTVIGWNFFGKINVQYLTKNSKVAVAIYSVIAIVFIFLGTLLSNNLVWELTDFFNYLMVLPNVIALFALTKLVVKNSKSNKK